MQTRSKCSSIVKLTRGAIQNFRSGQKQSFPKTMSKVVFDSQGVTLAWKKRPTITQYLNWRNIAFTQRALSHEDCIDLEPFQTAVVPHCAGSAFCLHNRFGNEHNTSHLSAQLGVSYCRGGQWGLISICFQLRDTENGQWCHASNRQNLWHFLAREIWFVNAGQLASRVACQEVPHLWLDCVHSVVKWEKTEQEKQIEPPETPNSYCCEDREKMATAGSTIPRALAQRGGLGQHKSWTPKRATEISCTQFGRWQKRSTAEPAPLMNVLWMVWMTM